MTGSRRALVTGATGFVGGHVARHLADSGWEVHAVVRPETKAGAFSGTRHTHDGTTEGMLAIVAVSRPDVVFHLASLFVAEHRVDQVAPLVASNLLLGTQLAEAMRAHGRTLLVNTGTAWQHFHAQEYEPVNLYAATKQAYLDLLRYYEEAAGMRVITLELYESYGPADPRPKLMTALVKAARQGGSLALTDGKQRLDLVHVKDIARAYARAAERLLAGEVKSSERWAVRTGQPRSVRELVELVGRAAGMPLEAQWGARAYRARELMEPPERPVLPGWQAEIPLDMGVRELLGDLYGGS
jgi:nucleoside-diphosphate-sugar epimerase